MPTLVNPLAAYRDAYSLLEGQAQDGARRRAGNALAGGDYGGAQTALYGRGMLQEGAAVGQMQQGQEDRQMGMDAAQADAGKKQAFELVATLGNINEAMARIPAEQRAEYFRTQIVPQLQTMPGVTGESIAPMLDPSYDWTDQGIASHRALLGEAASKLQVVNLGGGGVGTFDQESGAFNVLREPTPQAPSIPAGYRQTETGLEYIPGGPADPRVVGVRSAAGRAPRAAGRPPARGAGGAAGTTAYGFDPSGPSW